ncbi:MAG: cell division protein FtsQ/DivIB, partial [Alphaproteobacteria bacterium]
KSQTVELGLIDAIKLMFTNMWASMWATPRARWVSASGVIAAVVVVSGFVMVQTGFVDRAVRDANVWADNTIVAAGLGVNDVTVAGRNRTTKQELLDVLEVASGTSILRFSPEEARIALEELPWVMKARVTRRLPGHIHVVLEERRGFALWQHHGDLHLVDQAGTVIEGADLTRFHHLPLVVGEGANIHAAEAVALMRAESELTPLVAAATRVGDRRWTVRLENGVDVALPEENAKAAWAEFAILVQEDGILNREITTVDLRIPGRPTVRLTAEGAGLKIPKDKKRLINARHGEDT